VGAEEEVDDIPLVVTERVGAARIERVENVLRAGVELDLEGDGRREPVDGLGRDLPGLRGLGPAGRVDPVGDGVVGDVADGRLLELARSGRRGGGGGFGAFAAAGRRDG
jgi:hypothetical protein